MDQLPPVYGIELHRPGGQLRIVPHSEGWPGRQRAELPCRQGRRRHKAAVVRQESACVLRKAKPRCNVPAKGHGCAAAQFLLFPRCDERRLPEGRSAVHVQPQAGPVEKADAKAQTFTEAALIAGRAIPPILPQADRKSTKSEIQSIMAISYAAVRL